MIMRDAAHKATLKDLRELGRQHADQLHEGFLKLAAEGKKLDLRASIDPTLQALRQGGATDDEVDAWLGALEARTKRLSKRHAKGLRRARKVIEDGLAEAYRAARKGAPLQ